MSEEIKQNKINETPTPVTATPATGTSAPAKPFAKKARGKSFGGGKPRHMNSGRERVKPEFDSKIISMRRVTRVTKGGKRMSFSVAVISGDKKGRVGVGTGKAQDTSMAIDKAGRNAKKNMISVVRTSNLSIPHEVTSKYSSAIVMIKPAKGKGLIAGSAVKIILQMAGLSDINAKILSGSKNQLNIARATIKALEMLPRNIAGTHKVEKAK